MIRSITLQNFKSFGELQTVPLEPITLLVGPNNSGKSNFMSVGRFVSNLPTGQPEDAFDVEGGASFVFHRPLQGDKELRLGWESEQGGYLLQLIRPPGQLKVAHERISIGEFVLEYPGSPFPFQPVGVAPLLRHAFKPGGRFAPIYQPLVQSRLIKLSLQALRSDSAVVPEPKLTTDGAGLAAVLGLWRGSFLEMCAELDAFLQKCLPEIRHALVRPAPVPGHLRLWFRQTDGEEFDSEHVSDGVLFFTALTMHALDAGAGQLLFIEEPEQSIHPRRLRELVNLLKELVASKGCQFVIATHSPVLLNAFRDEPEAIVLFRRSETGTRVKRLEDIPELRKALQDAPPGEMLESGFFNQEEF